MFLGLLEIGILTTTKLKKSIEMEFEGIKLFATCNDIDRLTKPPRSRIIELHLPEYSEVEQKEVKKALELHRQNMELDSLLRQFKNNNED